MLRLAVAVLVLATIAGWTPPTAAQTPRPLSANLPEAQARERARRISDVSYEVAFRLDGEQPEYAGDVVARFQLSDAGGDLTMDFAGGTVGSLLVNGTETDGDYNDYYLTLPERLLHEGRNEVAIAFARPYSTDGSGLYRMRDPEDGRDYLYTDFEPFAQNRLFPSFDQPNLKARYTTEVTAPSSWQVIANTRETAIVDRGDERTWVFPATRPISTYLYALHAGEYHVWESAAGGIPLRVFARQSLVPYVHPEHWFDPTRQGLEFYQQYFGVPYPFGKYDQVIVPHFNWGAMENVGAVTFNERYLRRGVVTRQDRRALSSVILHEMAHMWFGDLVTMDWWSGLWLNESFATVMAVIAMAEATEFSDEWLTSYQDTILAYQADERDTTHPIDLPVPDTDSAFANFDRITYEKGSATLVQLMHLVGPEVFRRGVSSYLKSHSFGNTTLDDFLGSISSAADMDLDDWSDDWLRQPGTNNVEVDYRCEDGEIRALTILQTAPNAWPTLRTHRTQLGLYDFGRQGSGVAVRTLPVTYAGARTQVPAARGEACPDMIYPNHGDWDYARVRLDATALPPLDEHLQAFEDPMTRLMLWQSTWDMVLDARLPVQRYLEFALLHVGSEPNEAALRQVLSALQGSLDYLAQGNPGDAENGERSARVEGALLQLLGAAEPGSDRQLLLFDTYIQIASSDAALDNVATFLTDPPSVPYGIELDQDRRWNILGKLSEHGHRSFAELFATERQRDQSDEGQRRAVAVEVAQPDAALKATWIEALLDETRTPTVAEFRAIAGGLFPSSQFELQGELSSTLLDALQQISDTRDPAFLDSFVQVVLGPLCTEAYLQSLDAAIASSSSLRPIVVRELKDSRFETARCLKISRTNQ